MRELDGERFDAAVIGGGILGAGVARELARRRRRVLLVDRMDFGWGTTNRSTRLVHGGLRYLEQLDFGLVREGLRERAWLLRVAPNLVTPLPFLLPFHDSPLWKRLRLRAGLTLYDLLSPGGTLPRHRHLSTAAVVRLEPGMSTDRLAGAMCYWDGQVELPERLVIAALRSAEDDGAVVRNHVAATALVRTNGAVTGLELTDARTREVAVVHVPIVVNAAGPWADVTLAGLGIARPPLLRLTQGLHLVYPRLARHAVAFQHPDDGRLCFAIPWQGGTMIGTTDSDVDTPADAKVRDDEVRYVMAGARRVLPAAAGMRPSWAVVGVRSLVREPGHPSAVSRKHLIVDHAPDGAAGLTTLVGGKLTAFRSIAAETVDRILGEPDSRALGSASLDLPVPADPGDADPVARRLWRFYGARADEVRRWADEDPWWAEPLVRGADAIRAEVAHALTAEWAAGVSDVVHRRLALAFGADLGRPAAEAVAAVGAARFGWDAARVATELADFDAESAEHRVPE
jgi:glycerol-3-phosphate dehydrogenase